MAFDWDKIAGERVAYVQEKCFPAQLTEINNVFEFLTRATAATNKKCLDCILLIAEELFVNVASYAYKSSGSITISCVTTENPACIHLLFTDRGTPFDPTKRSQDEAAARVESLTPGGLGLVMVKEMADKMEYRRLDGENQLYIRKRLKE